MGDVHPTAVRTQLLERLSRVLPSGLDKTFLATTGSEAVEAALKTAMLATGKHRFVALRRRLSRTLARRACDQRHSEIRRTVCAARARRRAAPAVSRRAADRCEACTRATARRARRARRHRRDRDRTDPRTRRLHRAARRLSRRTAQLLRRARHAVDLRRDLHRVWTHRQLVRVRARSHDSRHHLHRQGDGRRIPDQRGGRASVGDGRVAALDRRSAAHLDLSRQSDGLRRRARDDRRTRTACAARASARTRRT